MMRDLVDQMGGGRGAMPRGDDDDAVESVHVVDLTLVLHYDTGKAVLVSETGEERRAVWLPKSQIEIVKDGKTVKATATNGQSVILPVITATIPDWLAKNKRLV